LGEIPDVSMFVLMQWHVQRGARQRNLLKGRDIARAENIGGNS
jgi:hypothetical protein